MKKFLSSVVLSAVVACTTTNAVLFADGWGTNLNCIFSSIRSTCAMIFGGVTHRLAFNLAASLDYDQSGRNNGFSRSQIESGCKYVGGGLFLGGLADAILTFVSYSEKKDVDQENKLLKEQNDRNMQNIGIGIYNASRVHQ